MSHQWICLLQKCSGKWTGPGVERWKTKDPETSLASWQCQQTLVRAADIKHMHPGAWTGNLSFLDLQRVRSGSPASLAARRGTLEAGYTNWKAKRWMWGFAERPAVLELVRMWELRSQLVSDDIGWWWQVGLTRLGLRAERRSREHSSKSEMSVCMSVLYRGVKCLNV